MFTYFLEHAMLSPHFNPFPPVLSIFSPVHVGLRSTMLPSHAPWDACKHSHLLIAGWLPDA
jgi:hypothetical protein